MNDFFRKHGKWILAVLGVVLMVLWVLPNNNNMGNASRADQEIGRLDGKKLTPQMLGRARNDLLVYSILDSYLQPRGNPIFQTLIQSLYPRDKELHLYLRLIEADKYHLTASPDEVNQLLTNLGIEVQKLREFAQNEMRLESEKPLVQAAADYLVLNKLDDLALAALQPSLPELRHLATDWRSRVSVRYLMLDAAQDTLGTLPAPTPVELQAQYETYKDVLPVYKNQEPKLIEGHRYPFGYKYPNRVRVEYLIFNRATVKEILLANRTPQQDQQDFQDAYRYYQDHPKEFTPEATPATSTAPASQPAVKPWDSVATEIKGKMLDLRVDKFLSQMTDEAKKKTGEPWKTMAADGYHEPVPPAKWVAYESVAEALSQEARFKKYRPKVLVTSGLMNAMGLQSLREIGQSYYQTPQNQGYPFALLAISVKELDVPTKDPVLKQLQVGLEGEILTDEQGNRYMYRVVEAEKTRQPKNLDEVKDQVVLDVQRRKTYEHYLRQGKLFAQEAAAKGLSSVADREHLTIKTELPFTRLNFGRNSYTLEPQPLATLNAVVPEFTQAAYNLALGYETPATSQPATAPATAPSTMATTTPTTLAAVTTSRFNANSPRTTSFGVEPSLQVFVMELLSFMPLGIDEFDQIGTRQELIQQAQTDAARRFFRQWNTLDELCKRVKYVPDHPFSED